MPDAVAELASALLTSPALTQKQQAGALPPALPVSASLSPSTLQRGFTSGEQFPPLVLQVGTNRGKKGGREGRTCIYLTPHLLREGGREGGKEGRQGETFDDASPEGRREGRRETGKTGLNI